VQVVDSSIGASTTWQAIGFAHGQVACRAATVEVTPAVHMLLKTIVDEQLHDVACCCSNSYATAWNASVLMLICTALLGPNAASNLCWKPAMQSIA
jgi:hypothetical protein